MDSESRVQSQVDRKGFNRVFGGLFALATLLLFAIAALLEVSELPRSVAGLAMAGLTVVALAGLALSARRRRRTLEQTLDLRIG